MKIEKNKVETRKERNEKRLLLGRGVSRGQAVDLANPRH